jgi:DNA-binding GntR family transcriptional regulator
MDALKRLASDGLVEIVPRRGTFVTQLTTRDVAELFDIRCMIELYAADRILKDGRVDMFLEDIQEPMHAMQQAMVNGDYGDYEAFITSDRELHLRLVKHCQNQRLLQIYRDMNVHIQVARTHYLALVQNARQAHQEHLQIIKAFQDHNPAEVNQALYNHIVNVKERILELLEEHEGRL